MCSVLYKLVLPRNVAFHGNVQWTVLPIVMCKVMCYLVMYNVLYYLVMYNVLLYLVNNGCLCYCVNTLL